ncbi:MAG: acyl-CoA dehydrogenase [Solirubrobacterales bacterium]|nr:acyl-CoA dehydrogenase [Solirubrobacterales bacterium]
MEPNASAEATSPSIQPGTPGDGLILNPKTWSAPHLDAADEKRLKDMIEWFENRGLKKLKDDDRENRWYSEFLEMQAELGIFKNFLTPARDAGGDPERRWDTTRICEFNELSGFYGLPYWYTWQVSILGLGPIFQSENEAARKKAADELAKGSIFAFGLSERAHGADIYSTDMVLTPAGNDGAGETYTATGGKYYIGNGNEAAMVSVFGRVEGIEGPEGYAFFAANSKHSNYELVRNVVNSSNYVSQFNLNAYPVESADVLHMGPGAFDAALNTVNIGKFNLGFASIGICEHAFWEAITHADSRVLYGMKVTDFPQVRQAFTDAFARTAAMKLFAWRAVDYFRAASPDDRRYLLFNPLTKMKVTTEGERVIDLLWDVIAAKGFERDMWFEMAARDIRALPKLEGTVHVNMALVLKFMASYLFNPDPDLAAPDRMQDPGDDEFLFRQGPARGLGKIRFSPWRNSYEPFAGVPNVALFMELAESFKELLVQAGPDEAQQKDLDFLLTLGELFTLIPYGQLICEQAQAVGLPEDTLDQIFDVMIRDFSAYAAELHGKTSSTEAQQEWARGAITKPVADPDRFESVWAKTRALAGGYEMGA